MSQNGQQLLFNTRTMSSSRAMRKLRRQREIERLRLQRKNNLFFEKPNWIETEIHMADDSRYYMVRIAACPQCGYNGQSKIVVTTGKIYHVECSGCALRTPEFESSQLAIRHWKLVSALSK